MPFPSSNDPNFQNEAYCKTVLEKMILICMRTENYFHINGFALSLSLKQSLGATRKHREPTQQIESSFFILWMVVHGHSQLVEWFVWLIPLTNEGVVMFKFRGNVREYRKGSYYHNIMRWIFIYYYKIKINVLLSEMLCIAILEAGNNLKRFAFDVYLSI